jgi:hypothetical protein
MFRTRVLAATAAGFVTLGILMTSAGATAPSKTVPPKKWAKSLCPALADFVTAFNDTDRAVASASSAEEAQSGLVAAIGNAESAAADVLKVLEKAGTPDTKKGKQTAAAYVKEFKSMKGVLADAGSTIRSLSTDDVAQFQSDIEDAKTVVTDSFSKSFDTMDSKTNRTLDAALQADSECKAITG